MTAPNASTTMPLVYDRDCDPRDRILLEVSDVKVNLLTGIYSEETSLPQPLLISVVAEMAARERFRPDTPLGASKNYMDLRHAIDDAIPRIVHFSLIEAIGEHIADTLFLQDDRIASVEVKIVKLAISRDGEKIGMTLKRHR